MWKWFDHFMGDKTPTVVSEPPTMEKLLVDKEPSVKSIKAKDKGNPHPYLPWIDLSKEQEHTYKFTINGVQVLYLLSTLPSVSHHYEALVIGDITYYKIGKNENIKLLNDAHLQDVFTNVVQKGIDFLTKGARSEQEYKNLVDELLKNQSKWEVPNMPEYNY